MSASLLRLGFCSRRLKRVCNINNDKLVNFRDFVAHISIGSQLLNDYICKQEIITVQQSVSFHSSCASRDKKKLLRQAEVRKEFLIKRIEKNDSRDRVEIWQGMSIIELAKQLKLPPKKVLEIIRTRVPLGHCYRRTESVIEIIDILLGAVRFLKKVPVVISGNTVQEDEVNLDALPRPPADPKDLVKRAPIVTIMGHVDHGKTTLLDHLRQANVVASEFGGITQHIGAFSVKLNENDSVTFIDTPGHAAFTSMRSRGANVTDIVVLVVAADDGVMEQTVESIRMANEAGATIIVAINKIDKPTANVKRTEEMLAMHELFTENMGGQIQAVPISALNGLNVDTLVEAILLQSEIMELKADPTGFAEGVIVESRQDPRKGKLATAIIQRGTLRKGAIIVAGNAHAKVRLMFNEEGNQISHAAPSTPVEVMGWRELPAAGDVLLEVQSEKRAQQVLGYRRTKDTEQKAEADQKVAADKLEEHKREYIDKRKSAALMGRNSIRSQERGKLWVEDTSPKVKVIIKGDVDGSVDAILDVLETYHNTEVPIQIVHYGVGDVTPTDIEMAVLFKAIIYCFNVKAPGNLKDEAKKQRVSIRHMNVIYRLINDLKLEVSRRLSPAEEEEILGEAEILQQFTVSEKRKQLVVAGLKVTHGEIVKAEKARLVRDETVLFDGPITSLRHVKTEVNSVKKGSECGLMLGDASIPVRLGDKIVCYKTKLVQKMVDWDPGF